MTLIECEPSQDLVVIKHSVLIITFVHTLKVIYKGFLNSCLVLYASETASCKYYVENRIRKFQFVHKLQRCLSSHYLFPAMITSLEKSMI